VIFSATKSPVFNRGVPPDEFLAELVAWGKTASESIFTFNTEPHDVFGSTYPALGPWPGDEGTPEWLNARCAAMLEIMRVLAGFESSWDWNCGVDTSNPESDTPESEEAGAWQVSYDSHVIGQDLRDLLAAHNINDGIAFQKAMKEDHALAMEYAARLFRHTTHENGPLVRHEVNPWLDKDSAAEFLKLMAA
jgi:hypothetical protein